MKEIQFIAIRLIVILMLLIITIYLGLLLWASVSSLHFARVERDSVTAFIVDLLFAQSASPLNSVSVVLVALAAYGAPTQNPDEHPGFARRISEHFSLVVLSIAIFGLVFLELASFWCLSTKSISNIITNLLSGNEQPLEIRTTMQTFFSGWKTTLMLYVAAVLGLSQAERKNG